MGPTVKFEFKIKRKIIVKKPTIQTKPIGYKLFRHIVIAIIFVLAVWIIFCSSHQFLYNATNSIFHHDNTCKIPKLNPFDTSIKKFLSSVENIDCQHNYSVGFYRIKGENNEFQIAKASFLLNVTCCYRVMNYVTNESNRMTYSDICFELGPLTTIPASHEFIHITCENSSIPGMKLPENKFSYEDMMTFVHPENIMKKTYWKKNLLNVLIIGLDAQSQMNFIRQMPKTHELLVTKLHAVQLLGYNKVGDNTFPNLVPLLTGLSIPELKSTCWPSKTSYFDDCPFIWKTYSQAGYTTSMIEDAAWMGAFQYVKKGFTQPPVDHYLHPFMYQLAEHLGHSKSTNCYLCYGPTLSFDYLLDYVKQTADAFYLRKQPYFQFVWANSLFHDLLNNPQLGDESLSQTLDNLFTQNQLNNTILLLLSDHGMRWGEIRKTHQGKIEERMPFAYFVLPSWFENEYPTATDNLKGNMYKLTTPYDIHETLKDILQMETRRLHFRRGTSLFSSIPGNRTCAEAGINEHWCICNLNEENNEYYIEYSVIESAANFVLQHLNMAIYKFKDNCEFLTLKQIVNVVQKFHDKDIIMLNIICAPNDAQFEVSLRRSGEQWDLLGEISRLDLYGGQSYCIRDSEVRKFCACKQ